MDDFWKEWDYAEDEVKISMLKNRYGVDSSIIKEGKESAYLRILLEVVSDIVISKDEEKKNYLLRVGQLTSQIKRMQTTFFDECRNDQFSTNDYSGDEFNEDENQIMDKINNEGSIDDDTGLR
jgi:hypothetical protein